MRGLEEPRGVIGRGRDQAAGVFQSHSDGDELLLRAVVEVAFDRPASVVGRLGDASAGCLQLPKPQSVGDVPEGHNGAAAAGEVDGRGRVGDSGVRGVFADEPVEVEVDCFPGEAGAQERALGCRER